MVAATQVFSRGIKAAWVTSQRSELQTDFRAAANLLQRDISMAGAGALGQQGLIRDPGFIATCPHDNQRVWSNPASVPKLNQRSGSKI